MQEKILTYLASRPGINLKTLRDALNLNRGTISYHLRMLERAGRVVSTASGRERRIFPRHMAAGRAGTRGCLLHGRTLRLAEIVITLPGIVQKTLIEHAATTRKTCRIHVRRLVAEGLVEVKREGRLRHYFPTQRLMDLIGQIRS